MTSLRYRKLDSPIGQLTLVANEGDELTHVLFEGDNPPKDARPDKDCAKEAVRQLTEYFSGKRRNFALRLAPSGTEFQKDVWSALCEIPYGETRSYAQIAQAVGRPIATRAVGAANGANPIPIIVPCHRVIGSNGTLTGFGGGLPTKRKLLELEGALEPSLL